METNYFALYQGKIVYVPEVPEKPTRIYCGGKPDCCQGDLCQLLAYEVSLEKAIASGIEVENEEEVFNHLLKDNALMDKNTDGVLYPLQCRVEVGNRPLNRCKACNDVGVWHCAHPEECGQIKIGPVARVTFEQPEKECPKCGNDCVRDSVHNGVGILYGPYGCPSCAWSEDERYDLSDKSKSANKEGGIIDQYGGWTRQPEAAGQDMTDKEELEKWKHHAGTLSNEIIRLKDQVENLKSLLDMERKQNILLNGSPESAGHEQEIEVTFGRHVKCLIKLGDDNTLSVIKAVNGWGEPINIEDITITRKP